MKNSKGTKCVECGSEDFDYSTSFDAEYCVKCGTYLTNTCSDDDCEICSNRPEKQAV